MLKFLKLHVYSQTVIACIHVMLIFIGEPYLICLLKNGEVDIYTLPDVTKLDGKSVTSTMQCECRILVSSYVGVQ